MKKLIAAVLVLLCIVSMVGCDNRSMDKDLNEVAGTIANEEELQQKFPEYYGLNTAKGLEVYVWQTAEDAYYCGVLSGTNRIKTPEEISGLAANGATVAEMKTILSSYDISNESISILPCKQPISDYAYQIDDTYLQKITELFGK